MPNIPHTVMHAFGASLLAASGLPHDQAEVASHHLVESNLMGHDSHGVIRIPAYSVHSRVTGHACSPGQVLFAVTMHEPFGVNPGGSSGNRRGGRALHARAGHGA